MNLKWHFEFQRCNSYGQFWGSDGWFDVTVFADDYSSAIEKAKKITGCDYVRAVKSRVEEIVCPNCGSRMDGE